MNITKIIKYSLYSFILILSLSACQSKEAGPPKAKTLYSASQPTKETIMDGLKRPWSMAFLSAKEALVTEKDGDLLKVNVATKEKIIIQGFPADVADSLIVIASNYPKGTYPTGTNGFKGRYNAGILDVVLDPDFPNNQWIYLSYVSEKDKKYATKVIRAKLQENTLTNIQTLLLALPYADGLFHFGGGLLFGQDGKLYISIGERLFGDALQPAVPIAQNLEDQRGKIYRLNADGSTPTDAPNFGEPTVAGLYAAGIRNTQGMATDPSTGTIWFTEHGTIQGDELNVLEAGANYGWPIISTGKYRGGYEPPKIDRTFTVPKWNWYKTIAPTGLTFYTGHEFPQWKNNLLVPGLSIGNLWRFVLEDDTIKSVEELFVDERDRIRKAIQSPDGALYLLTDEVNGRILRVYNR